MNVYKVNFSYAAPNGLLRSSALLIEAKDAHEAKEKAMKEMKPDLKWVRFSSVTHYATQIDLLLSKK